MTYKILLQYNIETSGLKSEENPPGFCFQMITPETA